MNAGKLPLDLLGSLLSEIETADPRVVLGPRPGEDAALIDFGDRYLVAKTDPITFATDLIGWYMVNVNANDLAVMGATPKWLLATLLLPDGTLESRVSEVFGQLRDACSEIAVTLIGGHTEVTYGLDRPIAVGAMLGEVDNDKAILSSGVRPGDSLILTKGIAVEGTSILAREAADELATKGADADSIERAAGFLFDPGISVLRDAQVAVEAGEVHAMHDPTEGGLSGGLYELATASSVGFDIEASSIPILTECGHFCEALGLDPLGLIASGSLLAAVAPSSADAILAALSGEGIDSRVIGVANDSPGEITLHSGDSLTEFPRFQRDELARFFSP
ncbi:MAG: hydrogenase expression/formation protein [Dehalococcoidia bacterium]|nr:hydrogenase expression/formation protein [Dehalococcoidia bacterium]